MVFPRRNVLHLEGVTEVLNLIDENGEMRFSGIMEGLKTVKNPPLKNAAALSYRLRGLEKAGFVKKRIENNPGEQVKIFYRLTDEGREALTHLNMLKEIKRKASQNVKEQL